MLDMFVWIVYPEWLKQRPVYGIYDSWMIEVAAFVIL